MRTVAAGAVFACAVGLGAGVVRAQDMAQTPVAHAPDGHAVERIQSISISGKTDAPFSATVVTSWTRMLEDGTRTTVKNHRTVARDSTGRIFEERRFFTPNGDKTETRLGQLEYSDPIRHELYVCNPVSRSCVLSEYRPAPVTALNVAASATLADGAGTVKRESLGKKLIADVEVVGSREIATINPGANGFTQPEPAIKEFWYSPRLDLNLVVKRFEPRGGAQDFSVENLNLSEPDPRLFTPPADYKIVRVARY